MKLLNRSQNQVLAENLDLADSLFARLKGLLGRSHMDTGTALWIKPCNNIHTWFMQFSIDAIFVNKNLQVVSTHQNLKPWRVVLPQWKAQSVFELKAGSIQLTQTKKGDQLDVVS